MDTEKYMGWTNQATWRLAVLLDNNEDWFTITACMDADQLKTWVKCRLPSFYSEAINFQEITEGRI